MQLPLHDIHLPDPVSWWPPAPGWWLLSALAILALAGFAWRYWHRLRYRKSPAWFATVRLQAVADDYARHGDGLRLVREVSVLLRQVCITVYPRTEAASLVGTDWLALLDRSLNGQPFTMGAGRILVEAPYQEHPVIDAGALLPLCREWIEAVTRGHGKAAR